MNVNLSPRTALILFSLLLIFLIAQGVWWITFMAILVDEKVEMATQLGASPEMIEEIHAEEISRQIMIGIEGIVFLLVLLAGLWLIYHSFIRLGDLKRHQENFLMAVTHELKTPLSSIQIYLDALESPKIDPEKKKTVIPKMRQDAIRLQRLVEKTLEAGRFDRASYRIQEDTFDISLLLNDVVNFWKAAATPNEVVIQCDIDSDIVFRGDRAAMQRALDAVFENALKYNSQSTIKIDASMKTDNEHMLIEIADNGIGLEKGRSARIFERFYRIGSELTRNTDGTGLGLYLCDQIIKAHHGRISVHSEGLNMGSRFRIELPRETAE